MRRALLRSFDCLLSFIFLPWPLPIAAPIVLIVLVTSGRPVFYRVARVGRGGHVFTMLKFRTLRSDAESRLGPYLGEELVRRTQGEFTPIGKWLKATQLDEIPQFWNVLRGAMSLVGPRPLPPVFFPQLSPHPPAAWARRVVRSALAGRAHLAAATVTKMLKHLAQANLVTSTRGINGGYRLARVPDRITIADIVTAMEGPIGMTECSAHAGSCGHEPHCGVRVNWQRINPAIAGALQGVTHADMVKPATKRGIEIPLRVATA